MANGAGRIFNVMKQTSEETNTIPSLVITLTVKSLNPLVLIRDDRLEITEEFCVFNKLLDKTGIEVGDILTAFTFNEAQVYFIQQNESKPIQPVITDYDDLTNRPKINNVILTGNKTGTQLGLVDAVEGKGLSTNDYTTAEKNKLAGIAEGANKTIVDDALSTSSTNPVQNKVITNKLQTMDNEIAAAALEVYSSAEIIIGTWIDRKTFISKSIYIFWQYCYKWHS